MVGISTNTIKCKMSESKIQAEIYKWFHNNYCLKFHNPRCVIFSVPNEREGAKEMMFLKSTGLLSGVSDLIVVIPNKVLFVELKTAISRQQPNQKDFEDRVSNLGFEYHLIRSLEEFQQLIKIKLN